MSESELFATVCDPSIVLDMDLTAFRNAPSSYILPVYFDVRTGNYTSCFTALLACPQTSSPNFMPALMSTWQYPTTCRPITVESSLVPVGMNGNQLN